MLNYHIGEQNIPYIDYVPVMIKNYLTTNHDWLYLINHNLDNVAIEQTNGNYSGCIVDSKLEHNSCRNAIVVEYNIGGYMA